jgi:hypothetical protein
VETDVTCVVDHNDLPAGTAATVAAQLVRERPALASWFRVADGPESARLQTSARGLYRPGEGSVPHEHKDIGVLDEEALNEIELMSNLIIAASEQEGPLTEERVDQILRLT